MATDPAQSEHETIVASHLDDAREYFKSQGGNLRTERTTQTAEPDAAKVAADKAAADALAAGTPADENDFASSIFGKKTPTDAEKAAADAAAKAAATATDDDPTKGLVEPEAGSKHRADWDKLKTAEAKARKEAADAKKLAADLEAKLKGTTPPEADAATKARLADLEKQNKEFSDRLKIFDVQGHPDFQREYVQPKQESFNAVTELLKTEGVEADLASLVALKGKAFNTEASKILAKLTPIAQPQFIAALTKIQSLDAQAAAVIANSDQFREQKGKEFQSRTRAVFDETAKAYVGRFAVAEIPADASPEAKAEGEAWNKAVQERAVTAERYAFGRATESQVADVAQKAASYDLLVTTGIPRITKMAVSKINALAAKLAKAEADLAAVSRSGPRLGLTSEPGDKGDPKIENQSHRDAARSIDFGRK